MTKKHVGKVIQVMGAVLDIRFQEGELLLIERNFHSAWDTELIAEVAQRLGNDVVRCIAMSSTDGLVREWKLLIQTPLQYLLESP